MPADYGATIDGVQGYLQWDLLSSQHPLPEDVQRFMDTAAAEVNGEIGDITVLTDATGFATRAANLVHLYGAAMAQDVAIPEQAGAPGSYSSVLWQRYADGLTRLATDAREERDTGSIVGAPAGAAHGFPACPLITRGMGL